MEGYVCARRLWGMGGLERKTNPCTSFSLLSSFLDAKSRAELRCCENKQGS